MTVRARVVISGRVQGVGYRYTCHDEAKRSGVAGWVRNLPDGTVEAEFEGPRPAVEAMIDWCRQGPPSAHVEDAAVTWTESRGDRDFRITH